MKNNKSINKFKKELNQKLKNKNDADQVEELGVQLLIEGKTIEQIQAESARYLKIISQQYKWFYVVQRGLLTGIFTGIGATIGLAVVLIFTSRFITSLKEIPLVDTFLQQTELDLIIEAQKNYLTQGGTQTSNNNDENFTYISYENGNLGIKLNYPSYFSSILEEDLSSTESDTNSILVKFQGEKLISTMLIYKNKSLKISGDSTDIKVTNPNLDEKNVKFYDLSVKIENESLTRPVFTFEFGKEDANYLIIGYGDPSSPALSREIFKKVIESIQ